MQQEATANFERFSDDIRQAMRIANREAKRSFAPTIDTPHLVKAIAQEKTGLGGILLRQHGVTAKLLRRKAQRSVSERKFVTFFGKLPLSEAAQNVVSAAVKRAIDEKHDAVGTGGILLAMLEEDRGVVGLLELVNIDLPQFKMKLRRYLHRLMVEAPDEILHLEPLEAGAA